MEILLVDVPETRGGMTHGRQLQVNYENKTDAAAVWHGEGLR